MKRHQLLILILILIPTLTACSTFDQRWKEEPLSVTPNTLTGKWIGEWASFTTHRGELKAIIQPDQAITNRNFRNDPTTRPVTQIYHATFKATYALIFTAEYHVDLTATPTTDGEAFTGEKDLGYFGGGLYHYQGALHQNDLQTTYQSPLDHGTFTLHRQP